MYSFGKCQAFVSQKKRNLTSLRWAVRLLAFSLLAHTPLHLELNQAIEFSCIFERELFHYAGNEAIHE